MPNITLKAFGGLDTSPTAPAGTLVAAENLSPGASPHLATRPPLITLATEPRLRAFDAVGNRLCYLCESALVLLDPADGEPRRYPLDATADTPHAYTRILPLGDDLFLAPSHLFSPQTGAWIPLAAHWHLSEGESVTFSLCRPDGTPYLDLVAADHAPAEPAGGSHWLDTAAHPHALYVFRESDGKWATVDDPCLRLSARGIGAAFCPGEVVTLHGLAPADLAPLEGEILRICSCGPDHLVLPTSALPSQTLHQSGTLLVDRPLPDIDPDTVLSAEGRLWVWERTADGAALRACTPGDPTNWYGEEALSVPLPEAEPVTAAIAHKGTLCFFTEKSLYRVNLTDGGKPRLRTTDLPGIPADFAHTLAALDNDLYYLSYRGVMRLSKGDTAPTCLSSRLHPLSTSGVSAPAAGAADSTYYLALRDAEGHRILTYRPREDTWQCIPRRSIHRFVRCGEVLYAHELSFPARILAFDPPPAVAAHYERESPLTWSAILRCPLPDTLPCRPTRLALDLVIDGAGVEISVQYNDEPPMHLASAAPGTAHLTLPLHRLPTRKMRLHLQGSGAARLTGLSITTM